MPTSYTPRAGLPKPAANDRNWHVPLLATIDALDGVSAVGALAVGPAETPSASLNARVAAGAYLAANGEPVDYAGSSAFLMVASSVNYVWLTDAGVLTRGAAWPAAGVGHVRLAIVTTSASLVLLIADARVPWLVSAANAAYLPKTGGTIGGPLIVGPAGGGTSLVSFDPAAGRVGFFGVTTQTQAAATVSVTDSTGGVAGVSIFNVGASFSQATLNDNFASLAAKVNALIAALKRHGLMAP